MNFESLMLSERSQTIQVTYYILPFIWNTRIGKYTKKVDCICLLYFSGGSAGKESACNADLGSLPGLGSSPGETTATYSQYSGLEKFMDYVVHEVAKSRTWLSDFQFTSFIWNIQKSQIHKESKLLVVRKWRKLRVTANRYKIFWVVVMKMFWN